MNAKDGQNTSVIKWAVITKNKPVIERIIHLHNNDPRWKGKIPEASMFSQAVRGTIQAQKKIVSGIGSVLSSGTRYAGKIAMNAISGGRKTRRKHKMQRRNHAVLV